jgi:hypothetical protein
MQDASMSNGTAIHLRLQGALFESLENWRRSQAKIPSRSEALRSLLQLALMTGGAVTTASCSH